MKAMHLVGISIMGAMSFALSGCGGGSSGAVTQPHPYGQPGYPQYNQQVNQPYSCQSGYIQFRNAFGNSQCYPTTVLSEACAQAGGILVSNGATCRKERQISGRGIRSKYRNLFGGSYSARIPLSAQLFAGESLKVYGNIDSNDWSAQLLQNGTVVGSAFSGSIFESESGNNLSIIAISNGAQPYHQNTGYPQGQVPYPGQTQYPGQVPYPGQTQYPGQVPYPGQTPYSGQYQAQYQYGNQGTLQSYTLELLLRGRADININGAAVSCEDGRGNSYPCQ